jgi:branched-subunit amino acid transport protein AzlD
MTVLQKVITIAVVVLATMTTRFLPYILFPEGKEVPGFVKFLGRYLAPAVFGLLVVYCLKNVQITAGSHGIPEAIALLVTSALYFWKKGFILPMAGGTITYMILVQMVFA